jgi:hypothetical protein
VHDNCYDVLFSQQFLENSSFNLDDYAYYFERNFSYKPELEIHYKQMVQQVDHWKKSHKDRFVELSYIELTDNSVEILDTRFTSEDSYVLKNLPAKILLLLKNTSPVRIKKLCETLSESEGNISEEAVWDAIAILDTKRLLWMEGDLILALPVSREIVDTHKANSWIKSWPSLYV